MNFDKQRGVKTDWQRFYQLYAYKVRREQMPWRVDLPLVLILCFMSYGFWKFK